VRRLVAKGPAYGPGLDFRPPLNGAEDTHMRILRASALLGDARRIVSIGFPFAGC
jgi:hypothetical protein